jgi:iron(III) transport system substrate-binding protein
MEEATMKRREFLVGAGGIAVAATAAGRLSAQGTVSVPAGYPGSYADLIEGSRSEGGLLIYSGLSGHNWEGVIARYRELYPWIDVQALELGSSEITERYLAESGTGSRTADLIAHSPDGWLQLAERDLIGEYDSPEKSNLPTFKNELASVYTFGTDPIIFVWNKALLPEDLAPRDFADLVAKVQANPGVFENRITTYNASTGSFGYSLNFAFAQFHGEKAWEWFDILGPMVRTERSAGPMVEKVTTGEYVLSYFCGPTSVFEAVRNPARAEILGWGYIRDGNPLMARGIAAMNNASSPNSARLMVDVMCSREGQIAFGRSGGIPARTDIGPADVDGNVTYASVVGELGADHLAVVDYNPGLVTDYQAFIDRWTKAYRL